MPNGFGFGRRGGRGRGMGFGFRGSSPPWPYVGLGRGGLPRHEYFMGRAAGAPAAWPYQQAPYPDYPGAVPFAPQMSREQELDFLKSQTDMLKGELEQIETRMRDLEAGS